MDSSPRLSVESVRPSFEATAGPARSSVTVNRPRPVSTNLEGSSLDYLREKESSRPQSRTSAKPIWSPPPQPSPSRSPLPIAEPANETSDLDYLRSYEEREAKNEQPEISGTRPSNDSFSEQKPGLIGKFSDAFKRFEHNAPPTTARTPSPLKELERRDLTPLEGPENLDGRPGGNITDDIEELSPEKRRELERQQLLDEEARVAKAQAEYRTRVATDISGSGSTGGPRSAQPAPRSFSIQNRVQSLLSQEGRTTPVQRVAEGYGKYSDAATAASKVDKPAPAIPRKPVLGSKPRVDMPPQRKGSVQSTSTESARNVPPASAHPTYPPKPTAARPPAPKKPMHLNSIPTGSQAAPQKALRPFRSEQPDEELITMDIPGQPTLEMTAAERDNYLEDFSKRFPSLSSIEMVERDLGDGQGRR